MAKGKKQWYINEIEKLLLLKCRFIVYPYLDIDENILNEQEKAIFKKKQEQGWQKIIDNQTEQEKFNFWRSDDSTYIEQMSLFYKKRKLVFHNGIPVFK